MLSIAIVGSGPYGLSLAAYLNGLGIDFRIFGPCMESWEKHMPQGMFLKSEGFASDLYAPGKGFPLADYCREQDLPYDDVGAPVPRATFAAYGREFQRRMVPALEQTWVTRVRQIPEGFALDLASGETVQARRVVLAVGITHFPWLPPELEGFSTESVTHSFQHSDVSRFRGKRVLVIGAGASATDVAVELANAGAETELLARPSQLAFQLPPGGPRSLWERIKTPRTTIGGGWRSKFAVDMPLVFHLLPEKLRHAIVARHLGPAPGWFMRAKFEGRVKAHLGCQIEAVSESPSGVRVRFRGPGGEPLETSVDHVIAATGFKPFLRRLSFLDPELSAKIGTAEGTPDLDRNFRTTVPGLYMMGPVAANNFGPVCRFACGAEFTVKRLAPHLARTR